MTSQVKYTHHGLTYYYSYDLTKLTPSNAKKTLIASVKSNCDICEQERLKK